MEGASGGVLENIGRSHRIALLNVMILKNQEIGMQKCEGRERA